MLFPHLVSSIKSEYGSYKVVDTVYNGRPARMLYGEKNSPQSGIATDESAELLFDYNQRCLEIAMSQPPTSVLVIGGGAFTFPRALYDRFPSASIDVVEIDPALVAAAYKYFDLPHDDRLTVFIEDGARYATRAKKRYDLIVIDAFSGYTIPPHLIEQAAVSQYARLLSENGVLAMNFISAYKQGRPSLGHEIVAAFGESFADIALYPSDPTYYKGEEQNFILTASHHPVHFEYLQSNTYTLYND